jgi:type VI secretion system protein ImpB
VSKEGSVAPKERVNIVYKPSTGNAQEEVELPLKILLMGDYTGRADDRPLEQRKPINVDKDNFNEVMASHKLELTMSVPDRLSGEKDAEMNVTLKVNSLSDFGPEGVVNQVPELRTLLELRSALNALKGPLGNIPAFRRKIQALLGDTDARQKLMSELALADGTKPSGQ